MSKSPKKITNRQARYLANLQRELHRPYTGRGMTRREAYAAINDCLVALGRPPQRPTSEPRRATEPTTGSTLADRWWPTTE